MKKAIISLFIFISLVLIFGTAMQTAEAAKICFEPNIPIPGMENVPGYTPCGNGGYEIGKDSIGLYINALYTYAARLAAVIAMMMLVIAAWQWLMAAGNASKIENAKSTIQGALIGLALLFAGQLLLNTISSRFVSFAGLEIYSISVQHSALDEQCRAWEASVASSEQKECGNYTHVGGNDSTGESTELEGWCLGQNCGEGEICLLSSLDTINESNPDNPELNYNLTGQDCPISVTGGDFISNRCRCQELINCSEASNSCDEYTTQFECDTNICYNSTITQGCRWQDDECIEVEGIDCDTNALCLPELVDDTGVSVYCCDKDTDYWSADGLDECISRVEANEDSNDGHKCYTD